MTKQIILALENRLSAAEKTLDQGGPGVLRALISQPASMSAVLDAAAFVSLGGSILSVARECPDVESIKATLLEASAEVLESLSSSASASPFDEALSRHEARALAAIIRLVDDHA